MPPWSYTFSKCEMGRGRGRGKESEGLRTYLKLHTCEGANLGEGDRILNAAKIKMVANRYEVFRSADQNYTSKKNHDHLAWVLAHREDSGVAKLTPQWALSFPFR